MAVTQYTWTVEAAASATIPADETVSLLDRSIALGQNSHLGFGLLRPFARDQKNDFANGGDVDLVKSSVGQVLGTRSSNDRTQGEMPWNTEFGSLLYTLRHLLNTDYDGGARELASLHVVEALQRWEPRVRLKRVDVKPVTDGRGGGLNVAEITIVYDIIKAHVASNQVFLPNVKQVFNVSTA